jgi:hypothetical protein
MCGEKFSLNKIFSATTAALMGWRFYFAVSS